MNIGKAQVAVKAFEVDYAANCPKAVAKITDDGDAVLEIYRYPAERWVNLRTTNRTEGTLPQYGYGPRKPKDLDRGQPVLPWSTS